MKNILILKIVTVVIIFTLSGVVKASDPINEFAGCLVDNLNGKERKSLAKWVYFAMAAHPEIKNFSKITDDEIDQSHKEIGVLITRLLTQNCPVELKTANEFNPQAIEKAFEFVGQVAMQELMTNKNVSNSLIGYLKYTDEDKIKEILSK